MKKFINGLVLLATTFSLSSVAIAAEYHVMINNQQQGPYATEQLKSLQTDGSLTSETLVWKNGMTGWQKAYDQPDLQVMFTTAPVPPSSASPSPPPPPPPSVAQVPPNTDENSDQISQQNINEQNKLSNSQLIISASDSIDDWADEAIKKFGISDFGEQDGKFFLFESQSVSLKPLDPQYAAACELAYDKAIMKIQEQYVMMRFGEIITEKIKSLYSDTSTNAKEISLPLPDDPDLIKKTLKVMEKGLDVAEKRLDKELIELGTDPNELEKLTPTMKKDLFRDQFIKKNIEKASGSIAGLFPIQTAVKTDKKGTTVIGVIAVASPKTIQIAKDIKLQRESIIKGKGQNIEELLPQSSEEYLSTLGTRLVYDGDGSPAIISYGISSFIPNSGDDYINDQLKSEAKNNATSNADAQIAEIINGHMNVKNDQRKGEEVRTFLEKEMKNDSDTIENTIKNIISITNNVAKSSASAKLQGISTVKTWRHSKDGQNFVGAVRVWKYSTLDAVNQLNGRKSGNTQKNVNNSQNFQESLRESKPINTVDDF